MSKKRKKNVDLIAQAEALAAYEALDRMFVSWTPEAMIEIAEGRRHPRGRRFLPYAIDAITDEAKELREYFEQHPLPRPKPKG
jgi:hypothetical protein